MEVSAILVDKFRGAGAAHDPHRLAALNDPSRFQFGINLAEMRIKRVKLDSFNGVIEDDVLPVIGVTPAAVHVGHSPRAGGEDQIKRFALPVSFQVEDVDAFMHLAAVRANAAEGPSLPGLTGGGGEEFVRLRGLEKEAVGSGEPDPRLG